MMLRSSGDLLFHVLDTNYLIYIASYLKYRLNLMSVNYFYIPECVKFLGEEKELDTWINYYSVEHRHNMASNTIKKEKNISSG